MAEPSSLLSALDFFGKDDPDGGVEKFKTVAFRALHEQRLDEELRHTKSENERLTLENAALSKQLRELQLAFDTNVGDRERVLAFKSKRIEELNLKLKESEAINASLLQTINGGGSGNSSGIGDSHEPAGSRAAMMALLQSGKPLFHALESCKEQAFKQLYDDKRAQCEQLVAEMQANDTLVAEMREYERDKARVEAHIADLHEQLRALAAHKDDAVHFLERKLVFEHDRLRREKDADVRACELAMAQQMRMQLDVTTQRTIDENARVQLELRYQSSQLEKLVAQLDQVAAENKQLQQTARMFEDMNTTLSRRVKFYEQLFAKMQHKEQAKSRHGGGGGDRSDGVEPRSNAATMDRRFHSPRKPPLPALDTQELSRSPLHGTQSAFALADDERHAIWSDDNNGNNNDDEWRRTLADSGDQLNSATEALDTHLQQRAFARKQVDAMLRLHVQQRQRQPRVPVGVVDRQRGVFMGPAPLVKKKIVLSNASYAPSSYQRGRKLLEVPTTLDSFIRQHASISPRQRTVSAPSTSTDDATCSSSSAGGDSAASTATVLPGLIPPLAKIQQQDRSEMWRPRAPPDSSPTTARF